MTQFKVKATAPTVYQTSSLRKFGMTVNKVGNGSFYSEQIFETEEEAKEYLVSRAEMYYNEFEGQADEHLATIEKIGYLEIDAVTAKIEEVEEKKKVFVLAFDSGARGTRYISQFDEKDGTADTESAKTFETKQEAEKFNTEKGYLCWVEEIEIAGE